MHRTAESTADAGMARLLHEIHRELQVSLELAARVVELVEQGRIAPGPDVAECIRALHETSARLERYLGAKLERRTSLIAAPASLPSTIS
jgi:hypothetical protein